jgi:hypothetical protein
MAKARTRRQPRARALAVAAAKYVVYVHGICRHDPGYSEPWFEAMKPYVPDVPDDNRREVLWSDIVHPAALQGAQRVESVNRATLAIMHPAPVAAGAADVSAQVKDVLADRAQRQYLEAHWRTATRAGDGAVPLSAQALAPQALFGIPGLDCVDDFMQYLVDANIRNQIIDRFHQVIGPLLEAPNTIEVISHSWGTVVAYEALRLLDGESFADGANVQVFFTAGSALSIPPVKRRLLPEAIDGARPRLVQNWVNLDARFDIVGGPLQGVPFAVDNEFLGLEPVGCSAVIPNPACAHGSYFNPQNLAVNRDIFGRFIES